MVPRRTRARRTRARQPRSRRGSLLLEAIFGLFLLGVTAMATLALLAHAMARFELAEARGRAVPLAGAWLDAPPVDSLAATVGPGELVWEPGPEGGAPGAGTVRFTHPRGPDWTLPAPVPAPPGTP